MAPDVRSSTGGSNFDFNSQAGVLAVLGAIRASELSASERNELRDLVFLYSNGGGDPAVRTVLEERLRSASITTASIPVKKTGGVVVVNKVVAPTAGFSGGRPIPVFTPVPLMATVIPDTKKAESVVVSVPSAPAIAPTPIPAPIPIPIPTPIITPVRVVPPPVQEVVTPIPIAQPRPVVAVPRPVVSTVPSVSDTILTDVPTAPAARVVPITPIMPESRDNNRIPSQPASIPVSQPVNLVPPAVVPPVPAPVAQPPVMESMPPAAAARIERIRQIKSDINSRVGNPVNLVDLDNALGREYMAALLEAMKLIADAPEADADRAMKRLDSVYNQVLTLLDQKSEVGTPVPPIAPIIPSMPVPVVLPVPVTQPVVVPQPPVVTTAWGEISEDVEVPVAPTPIPVRVLPTVPVASVPVFPPTMPAVPAASTLVQSVAASQIPLRSLSELPTADEKNSVNANGDVLFTGEVDAGLQQLLSEWSLFKKSGLFGTGPSGREHPLFLKIAPLQLPLLLAGRFEGSTQEIKQSVTDYMNGWRYEQGIVYEKDETFEQYLRRVIRHIIDLQNKKRGA